MIKAVRHFGIVVSDMERALRFYRDLLGLKVLKAMDESGEHIDNMLSLNDVQVTTVKMSAGGDSILIELLAFKSHRDGVPADRRIYSIGPTHVAFTVNDLEAAYHHLTDAGIHFHAPPQQSPDGFAKVTFCHDPDGTPIELVEVLRS